MQEAWVRFLGWEDPLEKGMAPLASNLRYLLQLFHLRLKPYDFAKKTDAMRRELNPPTPLHLSICAHMPRPVPPCVSWTPQPPAIMLLVFLSFKERQTLGTRPPLAAPSFLPFP